MISLIRAIPQKYMNHALMVCVLIIALLIGFVAPEYFVVMLSTAVAFGVLAAATDLCFGSGGILNLGPAITFGVGTYVAAVFQKLGIPYIFGILSAAVIGAILFAGFAWIGLSRRRSTIQFALFTLVASVSFEQIAISNYSFLGGSNGLANVVPPFGLGIQDYFFVFLLISATLCWLVVECESRFDSILILQRDEPEKAESLGFDPKSIKVGLMFLSGLVGGAVGAAFVPFSGIAYPAQFAAMPNLLVLVWIAVGGRGTIFGPFLAAVLLTMVQFEIGSTNSDVYLFVMGMLFVFVVAFFPKGLLPSHLHRRRD